MNITKVIGRTITSLTLASVPAAKADSKVGGAIYNSAFMPKMTTIVAEFSNGTNKLDKLTGGAIYNSSKGTGIAADTFEHTNVVQNVSNAKEMILPKDKIVNSDTICSENIVSVVSGKLQPLSGTINNQTKLGSEIVMEDTLFPSLQVLGTPALAEDFIPLTNIPLRVKDVIRLTNNAPKVNSSVDFISQITYGDNQTTNVLVSGLNKLNKFFKTSIIDPGTIVINK